MNGIFEHGLRGIGLLFIDLRHHKDDALYNIRRTRFLGNIGKCLEKTTSKAAAGSTDEDHASHRSDRINAGGSKSTQAD